MDLFIFRPMMQKEIHIYYKREDFVSFHTRLLLRQLIRWMGRSLCALTDSIQSKLNPCHIIVSQRRTKERTVRSTIINTLRHFSSTGVVTFVHLSPTQQHYSALPILTCQVGRILHYCRRICLTLTIHSAFFSHSFLFLTSFSALQVSNDWPFLTLFIPHFLIQMPLFSSSLSMALSLGVLILLSIN